MPIGAVWNAAELIVYPQPGECDFFRVIDHSEVGPKYAEACPLRCQNLGLRLTI